MVKSHTRTALAVLAGLALASCTMHKQEAPTSLTGPSGLGVTLTLTASPDVLTQDGASQSLVTITVYGPNGQPQANVPLRAEIQVEGASADFGTLSAKNLVTDSGGRATTIYTAPRPVAGAAVVSQQNVNVAVTPTGTDYANETPRLVTIRLVPQGTVGLPQSPLSVDFTAPSPTQGDTAVFTASVTDSTGANANGQVASYSWNFGDGATASGQSVSHTFTSPGNFPVTVTITDTLGRTTFTTKSVTVGQGTLPTATFSVSPANAVVNQTINFNGSGSTAAAGHRLTTFSWNFGDGTLGDGALATHVYTQAGTYTVTLKVTDDAGRKSALASQTVTVTTGNPVAQITISPPSATVGQTVSFIGSQSTAAAGRTIVTYAWDFGDGSTGSGPTTSHAYATGGTKTVTLIVTDDQGKQGIATGTVTIQ